MSGGTPEEGRPAGADAERLHQAMVDSLAAAGLIATPAVEAAFRAVPRHVFLPSEPLERAYADEAIPTKLQDGMAVSSSSQPAIMAIMLEQLALRPGHRVLEIGAGTGYNAALIAHIVGEEGRIVAVDIDEDIVAGARRNLAAAGFARVRVERGDGAHGFPEEAPYDRVVLTVAADDVEPAWVEQMAPGGRLLLPLRIRRDVQVVVAFERADGHLESVSVHAGSFMPLRGASAWRLARSISRGERARLYVSASRPEPVHTDRLWAVLGDRRREIAALAAVQSEPWYALDLWLALHAPDSCALHFDPASGAGERVPCLFKVAYMGETCGTLGLLGDDSAALLAPPAGASGTVRVLCYGPDRALGERLAALVEEWAARGRPPASTLRLRIRPKNPGGEVRAGECVIEKARSVLTASWPSG